MQTTDTARIMASQHSLPEAHARPGSRFTGKETGFHTGTPVEDTGNGGVAKRLNHDDTEGVGSPDDEGGATYPLDDFMVRTEMRTVADAVNRIRKSRYILNPGFQRDYVWDDRRASKLIESCIMRIPLPVIYVAEEPDGRIVVVDGQQRLVTFKRFLADDFPLTKLGEGHPLNGHRFSDLPIYLQERVEDTQLTLNILDHNTPERARLDIFQRVNSGETLTRQQMRNALYYGPEPSGSREWRMTRAFCRQPMAL